MHSAKSKHKYTYTVTVLFQKPNNETVKFLNGSYKKRK